MNHRSPTEWKALIEEQLASGLSSMAFCKERGLSAKSFYRQRKRLGYTKDQPDSPRPGEFIQVQTQPACSTVSQPLIIIGANYHQQVLPWNTRLNI